LFPFSGLFFLSLYPRPIFFYFPFVRPPLNEWQLGVVQLLRLTFFVVFIYLSLDFSSFSGGDHLGRFFSPLFLSIPFPPPLVRLLTLAICRTMMFWLWHPVMRLRRVFLSQKCRSSFPPPPVPPPLTVGGRWWDSLLPKIPPHPFPSPQPANLWFEPRSPHPTAVCRELVCPSSRFQACFWSPPTPFQSSSHRSFNPSIPIGSLLPFPFDCRSFFRVWRRDFPPSSLSLPPSPLSSVNLHAMNALSRSIPS